MNRYELQQICDLTYWETWLTGATLGLLLGLIVGVVIGLDLIKRWI